MVIRLPGGSQDHESRQKYSGSREAQERIGHCRQALQTFTVAVYEQEGLPSPGEEGALIGSVQGEGKEPETW